MSELIGVTVIKPSSSATVSEPMTSSSSPILELVRRCRRQSE